MWIVSQIAVIFVIVQCSSPNNSCVGDWGVAGKLSCESADMRTVFSV